MNKIEIGENWIVLRNPENVSERLRRPIIALTLAARNAMPENIEDADENTIKFVNDFNDLLVIAMVESWSFGAIVSLETLLDLSGKNYEAVRDIAAPFVKELLPSFAVDTDPKAPIEL